LLISNGNIWSRRTVQVLYRRTDVGAPQSASTEIGSMELDNDIGQLPSPSTWDSLVSRANSSNWLTRVTACIHRHCLLNELVGAVIAVHGRFTNDLTLYAAQFWRLSRDVSAAPILQIYGGTCAGSTRIQCKLRVYHFGWVSACHSVRDPIIVLSDAAA